MTYIQLHNSSNTVDQFQNLNFKKEKDYLGKVIATKNGRNYFQIGYEEIQVSKFQRIWCVFKSLIPLIVGSIFSNKLKSIGDKNLKIAIQGIDEKPHAVTEEIFAEMCDKRKSSTGYNILGIRCLNDKNFSKAIEYFESALKIKKDDKIISSNLDVARSKQGSDYYLQKNYSLAFQHFAENEEKSPTSKYMLGIMYIKGEGCKKDTALGLQKLEELSSAGFEQASHELGKIYSVGIEGIEKDIGPAKEYFRRNPKYGPSIIALKQLES